MTDLTREQIEALLRIDAHPLMIADAWLKATPDLARQLLATMTERDEAQAAQAGVCEQANALLKAAIELAEYASYAEIVGGISVNRSQIRRECDAVFNAIRILPEDENYEKSFLATASGVETLAALRAERDELKQKLISPDPYEDTAHPDDAARGETP